MSISKLQLSDRLVINNELSDNTKTPEASKKTVVSLQETTGGVPSLTSIIMVSVLVSPAVSLACNSTSTRVSASAQHILILWPKIRSLGTPQLVDVLLINTESSAQLSSMS